MPLALSMLLAAALAQAPQIDEALLENFTWRSVGPAGAGGRVVDVEVVGEFPFHIFVATASGGLWRSTNGGVTWEPIFDDQRRRLHRRHRSQPEQSRRVVGRDGRGQSAQQRFVG